jgi:uncharacterized protein (TIGR03437 family)
MLALTALTLAIPLHFEPNQGQVQPDVRYLAAAQTYTLALSDTGIRMNFPHGGSLRMNLPHAAIEALDPLPGKANYYFGPDPSAWRTRVPNYARVRYQSVFPGVDLLISGKEQQVEYDWVIVPGADPSAIRFSFAGASGIHVEKNGDLVLQTASGEIRHRKPYLYQTENGQPREVAGEFALSRNGEVRFHVGLYNKRLPLVIDPALVYAAGFGGGGSGFFQAGSRGTSSDTGTRIGLDRKGNAYILGTTVSTDFPQVHGLVPGPSPECFLNCNFSSIFIAKLSADGTTLLYSTYIGAPPVVYRCCTLALLPGGLTVDPDGNVYATGGTSGINFPLLGGGRAVTAGGTDAFVLELDPDGLLKASQLFGGSGDDAGTSITLGPDGRLYLTGTTQSKDFPVTSGAYRAALSSARDLFLLELNPAALAGNRLFSGLILNSTYLGPGDSPVVGADAAANAYLAASTTSPAPSSVPPQCAGASCAHIVIMKVNAAASKLVFLIYFGGSGTETIGGLAVDASASIYISGSTTSTDLPTSKVALRTTWKPGPSAPFYNPQTGFVAKLNPDATVAYATYLGGTAGDQALGIAVDTAGNAYVSGGTGSPDFPVVSAIQPELYNLVCNSYTPSGTPYGEYYCGSAGFLAVLNPTGSALVWSTYLGSGIAYAAVLDPSGNVYVTGENINPALSALASSPSGTIGVLKIAPQGTPLQFSGVGITNGFSFHPGLPRPGGIASIFVHGLSVSGNIMGSGVPLPTELAGVSVLVDGKPAPLLGVANLPVENPLGMQQINLQVPFEAKSNLVEVHYGGMSTFAMLQTVAPGILTLSDGSPAIQHASDYSLVTPSHPASKGEVIIIYATGLGPVNPPVPTGMPATGAATIQSPCSQPQVSFGNTGFATVLYAGVTPGFVGLYQMNVQLSSGISSGNVDLNINFQQCWFGAPPPNYSISNTVTLPVQ